MIEALIDTLAPIFNGKDWVGRYGGLVETWTRQIAIPGDTEATKAETFPVSRGTLMDQNCDLEACASLLLPDERQRSVVFWHLQGDVKIEPPKSRSRSGGNMQYTQTARLIVWLNFQGCNNCDDRSYAARAQELINALNRARVATADPIGAAGRIKLAGEVNRNPRDVFGDWSFVESGFLFVAPFDFFALDFTFEWFQNATCQIQPVC